MDNQRTVEFPYILIMLYNSNFGIMIKSYLSFNYFKSTYFFLNLEISIDIKENLYKSLFLVSKVNNEKTHSKFVQIKEIAISKDYIKRAEGLPEDFLLHTIN